MYTYKRSLSFIATGAAALGLLAAHASGVTAAGRDSTKSTPACTTRQIHLGGYWTYGAPKKTGSSGTTKSVTAHVKLSNTASANCKLTQSWPRLRLDNAKGQLLPVREKKVDAAGAPPPPLVVKGKQKGKYTIVFQWLNWCKTKPVTPIEVAYTPPHSRVKRVRLGLGKGQLSFHLPPCSSRHAASTINVNPYEPPVGPGVHY